VVVNTVHGLYAQPTDPLARRLVVYALERAAAAFSDGELVQNPEDVATLRRLRVPSNRLHLLGNGIDLSRFGPRERGEQDLDREAMRARAGAAPDEYLVVAVGRLVAEKGYPELIEAMALLHREGSSGRRVRLAVIGPHEPTKSDGLDERTIEAARANGVEFLGFSADVERWYRAADAYVLASHREGFPRTAMEAAASALPVIATDIRGCRQVVEPEVTGVLVPVGSAPSLAAAMRRLADSPELGRRWGQAGRAKALAEFDQQLQVRTTLDLYERLLPGRQPR
jgi:glycosyltransferase involved in cell wall biosynthesis